MAAARTILIVVGILALILGAIGFWTVTPYLTGPPDAELRVDSGMVEMREGDEWSRAPQGIPGATLEEGTAVRTKEGAASIIFFGSSLLRLDANTQVTLVKVLRDVAKIQITQESGRTWNRLVHASGNRIIEDGLSLKGIAEYSISMPTAVATVRGTSFSTDAEKGMISVTLGTVSFKSGDFEQIIQNATAIATANGITVTELQKDTWILQNEAKDVQFDIDLIKYLKEKYWFLIDYAKKEYNATDEQIDAAIRDYLARGGGDIEGDE